MKSLAYRYLHKRQELPQNLDEQRDTIVRQFTLETFSKLLHTTQQQQWDIHINNNIIVVYKVKQVYNILIFSTNSNIEEEDPPLPPLPQCNFDTSIVNAE